MDNAKIYKGGMTNWPEEDDFLIANGDLYRVAKIGELIETTGTRGNWIAGELEPAEWDELPEDWADNWFAVLLD
jgi:hypothetical protein